MDVAASFRIGGVRLIAGFMLLALSLMLLLGLLVSSPSEAGDAPNMILTDADLSFSRMDIVTEEQFTVYARVRNLGGSEGSANVRFYVDPENPLEIDNASTSSEMNITVLPGGYSIASFTPSLSAGFHNISVAVADVDPQDSDPENNVACTPVEVFTSRESVSFSSPTLLLEPLTATIQGGSERVIPLVVTVRGGDATGVTLTVLDSAGVYAEAASQPIDIEQGQTTKIFLRISVPELGDGSGLFERDLLVQAIGDNARGNAAVVGLSVHPPAEATSWWNPTTSTATLLGIILAVMAVINSAEWGKYKFLGIILPLYTKLKKEDVLNQYTRGKIHGYLLANPGDYFNSISKALGISSGTLAYHLRVLEREGEVISKMDGMYKRFYPRGSRMASTQDDELSQVQRSIYRTIDETPGIIQKDIASVLGVTSPTVSYHLQKLVARGLVRCHRKGMAMRYYVATD